MIWIIASAVELGMWLGWLGTKMGSRERIRSRLIEGTSAQANIPIVESRLAKQFNETDKWDRRGAKVITKTIHTISSYRAFEMLIAYLIHIKRTGDVKPSQIRIHI
jgi:hypothetical protein